MLLEFTIIGQVIPTRLDIIPYRQSPYYSLQESNRETQFIDILKSLLVVYTFWAVLTDLAKYKTCSQILSFKAISSNFVDLIIILSQSYTFYIKVSDKNDIINKPAEYLYK